MAKPKQPVSLYTWGCSLFAAVGSLLYGIDSGIISTTISQPAFLNHFAPFTPSIKGAVVSIFSAGSLFGVLFAGWAADYWGNYFHFRLTKDTANQSSSRPQKNYPVCLDICIVSRDHSNNFSQCEHAYCRSHYWRFCRWHYEYVPICSWCFGPLLIHIDMTIPIYNSEIAPPAKRGMIAGLHAQFVGVGFAIANWVGFGSSYSASSFQWRFPLALRRFPPIAKFL
jgi:hypothetical protein